MFSLRDARCIPPQHRLLSSRHNHMVGLYSSLHPLTYRAPVGIQFPYNHDCSIPPASHTQPSLSLYYYCHLWGQIWPCWPSDLSKAYAPREATTHTPHPDVCMYEYCDVCVCNLMPCDRSAHWPAYTSSWQLEQTRFQTIEFLSVHFEMFLLGKAPGLDIRVTWGGECPVITLQYPWGMGLAH